MEHFLKQRQGFGKKQISRLKFRQEGLLLNGERCRVNQILRQGDCLGITLDSQGKARRQQEGYEAPQGQGIQELKIPDQEIQNQKITVIYEDEDVLAVYKPSGIPVHPSHGHGRDTLWNLVISYQQIKGQQWTPRAVGRLDRDTSGIVLFAKNTEAAAALAAQRQEKTLRKLYIAEATGRLEEKEGTIDLSIEKDPDFLNRMRAGREGLAAATHYRVLQERVDKSLLLLELEQGRTHQIRVHLSATGHPVTGDSIYNEVYLKGDRSCQKLRLHAGYVSFRQPFTRKEIVLEAPFPEWMEEWKSEELIPGQVMVVSTKL